MVNKDVYEKSSNALHIRTVTEHRARIARMKFLLLELLV